MPVNNLQRPAVRDRISRKQRRLLLLTAAISSGCGLAVELLLGTLASYLVGNQALAYGVTVGGFLAAMGLGAYLSQFVAVEPGEPGVRLPERGGVPRSRSHQLQIAFVWVELGFAPLSALLPLGLFVLFVVQGPFWLGLFLATILLGTLAGMELPILTRLLEQDEDLKQTLAGVLALDYVGALLGALLLPLVLLPSLGIFPAAALIGAIPAATVFVLGQNFPVLRRWGRWGLGMSLVLVMLTPLMVPLGDRLENTLYGAPVISRTQSRYQRIVLTRQAQDLRMFLDGDLQFSTLDEYRYHEALVHPAMLLGAQAQASYPASHQASHSPRHVLLMGAGDGLALREVLKWPQVERVVLMDLDPAVVQLAQQQPLLVAANDNALADPRVEVVQGDAFLLAPKLTEAFDVIIADFPDPDRDAIAKLYAQGFYRRLMLRLNPGGIFVTQASSPFFAPQVFACIAATLESVGLSVHPYTINVPSFGPWGFVLATRDDVAREGSMPGDAIVSEVPLKPLLSPMTSLPIPTRFLTPGMLPQLFELPGDITLGGVDVNRLVHPVIVKYQNNARWATYD